MTKGTLPGAALAFFLCACQVGDDAAEADGGADIIGIEIPGDGTSSGADGDPAAAGGGSCLFSSSVAEVSTRAVDRLDLLFVVDNTESMAEEQQALRRELPRLISALSTGDLDGDDVADFAPARDLHLGVVSTDMGLIGIQGIPGCEGLGDDGVMNNVPSTAVAGCQATYPRFISFTPGVNDPVQSARDFGCLATLGTEGCRIEQPLEAGLKALWPSVDFDPETGMEIRPNRITFLGDVNGFGQLGHGDTDNAGFLRNDPAQGESIIGVIVVTDEEDCSSVSTAHFTPDIYLDPNDPLAMQDLNLRCFYNPQNLYNLDRYVNGLRALRPGNEDLVFFAGIVGVPPDLVSPDALAGVDRSDEEQREAFFEGILADPRMQEVPDPDRTPEQGGNLAPSCITETGRAYPPRRIVELARRFGANGVIQSICQDDFGPAIDAIIGAIAPRLGVTCLPRQLRRGAEGTVDDCELLWELPPPSQAPPNTPTECQRGGWEFLLPTGRVSDRGGSICRVAQLAVADDEPKPNAGFSSGWFYDDFSEQLVGCAPGQAQRIAFTPDAEPPSAVTVRLVCDAAVPNTQSDDCDADVGVGTPEDQVGAACLPRVVPEGGFDEREAYLQTGAQACGGGACLVFRLGGDPLERCVSSNCASPDEVQERVYCSCRCDGADPDADYCACPEGFTCVDLGQLGPESAEGSYCARNGTFTSF
ncbi:MAG: hypothetical protein PVI30_24285 [Myxococcales bacterium]|jgi:hypothetical protein